MKSLIKIIYIFALILMVSSCKDLTELNKDPNNPEKVSTATLMTGAQKKMMDNIYDNWFSGRQALPYAQYWAQRTYTEEDRYQIRESVNNNYFNTLYTVAGNLNLIEELNTDPETKVEASIAGDNNTQIASAKILKIWLMQLIADTWGSVPYSEAFKLDEGIVYAKYDDLNVLYPQFINEITEAVNLLDSTAGDAFGTNDLIYGGSAAQWKKFGNSLKCRLALRLSKVDPNWRTYIAEAVASGVFESNADNAVFTYSKTAPNQSWFYRGFFIEARNDFSITKPFVDLLKGQVDTLNPGKTHPFVGVRDPRLEVYTTPRNGDYIGLPYGLMSSQMNAAIRNASPNFYAGGVVENAPLVVQAAFTVPFMTYPELQFILSEYNNFSAPEYLEGIRSSMEYWNQNYATAFGGEGPITAEQIDTYIAAVGGTVNPETVATQKYIHLYMNGTEAWAEYRRTGYPVTLLKPGENSYSVDGTNMTFDPISDVKGDIPARVKYPTNESTLNGANFDAAVAKLGGENNYFTKMYWDVRSDENPHPQNLP